MLKLSIIHSIFLNEEQINSLRSGQDVTVIAPNLPVWSYGLITSEPAEEVFCKYIISPNSENNNNSIKTLKDGYKIYLPDYCQPMNLELTQEQFNSLSEIDKQNCIFTENKIILKKDAYILPDSEDLIFFEQIHKIRESNKVKLIIHSVKIRNIKQFFDSIY